MKRNRRFLLLFFVTILVIAFSSFIFVGNPKFPGYTAIENGSYFRLVIKGNGKVAADTGGAIFMKIKFVTVQDSVFLDINQATKTASYPLRVDKAAYKGDFLDILLQLHVGDSASFFMKLDSLKKYYPQEFVFETKYDSMEYVGLNVKVDSIYSPDTVRVLREKFEVEEQKKMAMAARVDSIMTPILEKSKLKEPSLKKNDVSLLKHYLKKNKIAEMPDADGVYYVEKIRGEGSRIATGNMVSVRYVGTFLDGTMFDANTLVEGEEPMTFQLDDTSIILGFNNSVAKMRVGGKSTFIIPPKMGYNDSLTRIFDVEVVDVKVVK